MDDTVYDAAVLGGGILGCTAALHLARGGMKTVVIERGLLCGEASGRNAGTLAVQYPRAALTPYAMRAWELWNTTREWLGSDVDFTIRGGVSLAFTDEEAALLDETMSARRDAGAPIKFIGANALRTIEPNVSSKVLLASHCPIDAYADSSRTGLVYRRALREADVSLRTQEPVTSIDRDGERFVVTTDRERITTRRVVLAAGAWNDRLGRHLGFDLPVRYRVNQVIVTERMPPIVNSIVGVASGRLSLKQKSNGTILIGGGWTGAGDPGSKNLSVIPENLVGNLRLAQTAFPGLADARVVRTWFGVRDNFPDYMPAIGALPNSPGAFIITCGVSGYTMGPLLGRLLAQLILGEEPEMPLFDPARVVSTSFPRNEGTTLAGTLNLRDSSCLNNV